VVTEYLGKSFNRLCQQTRARSLSVKAPTSTHQRPRDRIQFIIHRFNRPARAHIKMAADEDHHFHPKDTLKNATFAAGATGAVGLCFAAIQNSLAKSNIGAWAVITRGGGTITYFSTIIFDYLSLGTCGELTLSQLPLVVRTGLPKMRRPTCERRMIVTIQPLVAWLLVQLWD
jgi:hypothetical protein